MGHEDGLTGQHPLARAQERVHEPARRLAAIAHAGLEPDAVLHVIHCAGLGDDDLGGVQFHLDDLHVVAENLVINLVASHLEKSSL